VLAKYPVVFSHGEERRMIDVGKRSSIHRLQNMDRFEETLIDRLVVGSAHMIPETEIEDLNLLKLFTDQQYVTNTASKVRAMTREWKLSSLLSSSQKPGKYVAYDVVKGK
jgi:hypothetical protein